MKSFLVLIFALLTVTCVQKNSSAEIKGSTPEWAQSVVWYQIFPERFRNGDTSNDPAVPDMKHGWPYVYPEDWSITPWTSDWYELQPWEKNTGKDFYGIQGARRYGGDLQGVIDKLDYLQDLGITALYFNPLFESPSLHKYDAAMFHHIDNNFGPDPAKDQEIWKTENPADPSTWKWTTADKLFLKLISEAHKRGIRVVIDGVFNHVGAAFWAFLDVVENQQKSAFKEWFIIKQWDNPDTKENEFEYEGWFGVKDLPEIKEDENGLVEGPAEHVHDVVKRWMDPNGDGDPSDGIDGWRLDVAEKVEINFWRKFNTWVKEINPDAYITGEIWWEDWGKNKMFNAAPWLSGGVFDAVMNYRFGRALKQFIIDQKGRISGRAFVDSLNAIEKDYGRGKILILQNLMDSHDMERLSSGQTIGFLQSGSSPPHIPASSP